MNSVRRIGRVIVAEIEAKSVLNRVRKMPFKWSINPYQGCLHGCVFCYARKTHAYREEDGVREWGTRLTAKLNAAAVLRDELRRLPADDDVALGTSTDPYQAIEAHYRLTRGILGELARFRVSTGIVIRSLLY